MKPTDETTPSETLPMRARVKSGVRVLSVGLLQSLDTVYASILIGGPCQVTQVNKCNELDSLHPCHRYDAIVLGEALCGEKLVETARIVRDRWPGTYVLAVSSKPLQVDDTLYDDRILPGYSAKVMVAEVLRLMEEYGRQRRNPSRRWSADGE